jgi:hypothetical protein
VSLRGSAGNSAKLARNLRPTAYERNDPFSGSPDYAGFDLRRGDDDTKHHGANPDMN